MGGYSSEVEISLKSGNIVYQNMPKEKYNSYRVHILKNKWVALDDFENEYEINKHDFSEEVIRLESHINLFEETLEIEDAIGDCVVVLTNLAYLCNTSIESCIEGAYSEISGRTGKMVNGTFVKDK